MNADLLRKVADHILAEHVAKALYKIADGGSVYDA